MSGKSTIVRQLDMMHQGGYTIEQRLTYRTTVRRNLLESAHCILVAMRGEDQSVDKLVELVETADLTTPASPSNLRELWDEWDM